MKRRHTLSKTDQARIEKGLEPIEDENTAQKKVVQYLELLKLQGKILKFTAIPNNTFAGVYVAGNKLKNMAVAKKQVAMGLRRGLCDMLIVYQPPETEKEFFRPRILFLEMKRQSGGTIKPEQKEWIKVLNQCANVTAEVAKGFEDAKTIIDQLTQ